MLNLVIGLIILTAVMLVLIILAQNSKGGGLSSQFGGAGASQVMGVKKTGDFLEKLTWGLAITLIILTMSTKFFVLDNNGDEFTSPNIESAVEKAIVPNLDGLNTGADPADDLGIEGLVEPTENANDSAGSN